MSTARRSPHMNVMVDAVEKAGRFLVRDFGEVENLQVSRKGPGDFVSNADHKSEQTIVEILQRARPTYSILGEEGSNIKGSDESFKWIIDPLDGTENFLHGIPHWNITVALEKDKEIVAGVVYDPIKDELFSAEKGMGAFLNNRRLRVAQRNNLNESLSTIGIERADDFLSNTQSMIASGVSLRRFGSAALDLAYVAAGRFDVFWERGLKPWDCAAGALLIKESGGYVTDIDGGKDFVYGGSILAANPTLHKDVLLAFKAQQTKIKSAS